MEPPACLPPDASPEGALWILEQGGADLAQLHAALIGLNDEASNSVNTGGRSPGGSDSSGRLAAIPGALWAEGVD